jgi:subtilisin family serine protease
MPETLPPLAPVRVGLVDGGVDGAHPDLQGRIVAARGFGGQDPLFPDTSHGTMVAGLIAATPGNGIGIDGLSPSARLVVASVSRRESGFYRPTAVAAAIRWTADQHVRVLNLSLSGPVRSPVISAAVRYAVRNGVLVVAAGGNCFPGCGARSAAQFPAADPDVLAVGALDANEAAPAFAAFSVRRGVDLVAPGERLTTLLPTLNSPYQAPADCAFVGTTACFRASGDLLWGATGSSYAAPIVSAAASVLFAARPQLRAAQVAWLLERTAQPLPGGKPGVLQVGTALERALHAPLAALQPRG